MEIPLDVIVLIAKYCIEEDWKMGKTFYSLCTKLQKKPYIKQHYKLYKENCVSMFLQELGYYAQHDYVNHNICIVLNINEIEHKIIRCERIFDTHFCLYKNEEWMWKIIVNRNTRPFLQLFIFHNGQHIDETYLASFSWTQWHGINKINITYNT